MDNQNQPDQEESQGQQPVDQAQPVSETPSSTPVEAAPAAPPPSQASNPHGRNLKKWILIGGIIIVISLTGTAFVLSQQKSLKPEVNTVIQPSVVQTSPNPDPTADWKTYNNTQYDYSFKYPPTWFDQFSITVPCKTCGGSNPGLGVQVNPNIENLSAKEFAQREVDEASKGTPQPTARILTTPLYFSGLDAALADGFPGGGNPGLYAYILHEGSVYLLKFDGVDDKTANFILSTFKFTNPAEVIDAQKLKFACEQKEGIWLEEHKECESSFNDKGMDQKTCTELGGVYDDCASPCRHDSQAEVCMASCDKVCRFN